MPATTGTRFAPRAVAMQSAETRTPSVTLEADPPPLLGLLLQRLLTRAAAGAPGAVRRLNGTRVRLRAGAQSLVLAGSAGGLQVIAGDEGPADAEVRGDLAALLAAARGRVWRELLTRRLRVRGKVWRAWPLLALLQAMARGEAPGGDTAQA